MSGAVVRWFGGVAFFWQIVSGFVFCCFRLLSCVSLFFGGVGGSGLVSVYPYGVNVAW